MRKRLTAVLIALQLAFTVGLVAYGGGREEAILTKGTEVVFLTQDASLTPQEGGAALTLTVKGAHGNHDYTALRDNQYFTVLTLANGRAVLDDLTGKKPEGDYVLAAQPLEKEAFLSAAFLDRYFPGWRDNEEPFLIENAGHVFWLKAKIWRGQVRFIDILMDGESIAAGGS